MSIELENKSFLSKLMTYINLVSFFVIFCTLVSFASNYLYPSDILDSFRYQYCIFLGFSGILNIIIKNKYIAMLLVLFSITNLYIIFPHLNSSKPISDTSLRIYYSNILMNNSDQQKIIHQINKVDPDIIGLVEVSHKWKKSLQILKDKFPYNKVIPQEGAFGIAIYSKYEFENVKIINHNIGTTSIYAEIKNKNIGVYLTHPLPPISKKFWVKRNEQFKEIFKFISKLKTDVFLMGDFNSVPWNKQLKYEVNRTNLSEVVSAFDTWPESLPVMFRITLDHAYVSRNISASKKIMESIGSDHLPIVYSLQTGRAK